MIFGAALCVVVRLMVLCKKSGPVSLREQDPNFCSQQQFVVRPKILGTPPTHSVD